MMISEKYISSFFIENLQHFESRRKIEFKELFWIREWISFQVLGANLDEKLGEDCASFAEVFDQLVILFHGFSFRNSTKSCRRQKATIGLLRHAKFDKRECPKTFFLFSQPFEKIVS